MASPTQEYPSWLTPVPTVIFDGNGVPIATSTTILFLPLTYYGPSIPLGPDWTYGGLTPPPSTTPPLTTSETSITTSTATPTSSLTTFTSMTSTAIPSSSSPSPSLSSSESLNPPTPSASSTPTGSTHMFSRTQIIGIIVGTVCGFLGLFIFALIAYLCFKRRRHRAISPDFSIVSNRLNGGYQMVGPEGRTTWAEGSPRHSGEEGDPFLRRNGAGPSTQPLDREVGGRPGVPPYVGVPRVPVPDAGTRSSGGSSSNQSGYGTLVERPTLNLLPDTTKELAQQRRGPVWSSERPERDSDIPTIQEDSPLVPPPRLLDPDRARTPDVDHPPLTSRSSQFSLSDAEAEAATLQTARRVRAEDLASRTPSRNPTPGGGSSGRNSGLWASLGLDRLNWLGTTNGNSRRSSRRDSRHTSIVGYEDPEIGRALLGPPEMSELPLPPRRLGVQTGDRPISGVSAQSGNSVYLDARTSLPSTPVNPLPPLPQASAPPPSSDTQSPGGTSSSATAAAAPAGTASHGRFADPPGQSHALSANVPSINLSHTSSYDILDTPIPAPVSHFTSTSSLRATDTGSSLGTTVLPFPPGLGISPHKSWTDDSSSAIRNKASSNGSQLALSNYSIMPGIMIDVLEEAPPSSEASWRTLAGEQTVSGRRTTFGQFVAPDIASEQASVYTHLSPAQSRSTGSAPNSRRDLSGSTGSGSSHHPSVLSAARTHSSGQSLSHSTSISSDARKRGGASPVLSAFGGGGGGGGHSRSPTNAPSSPILNTPPPAHFVPERAGMHRMMASVDEDELSSVGRMSPPEPASPLLSFGPWAGGLDRNWSPT